VLVRCRLNRLSHIDRVTGEPARRYEWSRPGELIHVDVKKLGNIPDGGGWRFLGTKQGDLNRRATRDRTGSRATAVGVLYRAVAWFAERGVIVELVLSDNGSPYVSHLWRDSCADLGIKHKRTRPRRPQTNGKIERLHRTLNDGWAYKKLYRSEKTSAARPWQAGCTSTTTTGPTQASVAFRPPPAWTTCLGITADM
jgi:transposase InsO family protein